MIQLDERDLKLALTAMECWKQDENMPFDTFLQRMELTEVQWIEFVPKINFFLNVLNNDILDGYEESEDENESEENTPVVI